MKMKGSKIVIECLKEQGVDTIFGYPGGTIMPVYDSLYDYRDEITHVLTSHEQGATHAADGYARSTGKVGVAFATSGPGATNTVTGIATAYMDSVPLVVITGQVGRALIGRDSFQEVDITGITMPITKHNFFVSEVEDLARCIRDAFRIAMSGRPGPVLVDIPKDLMGLECEYQPQAAQIPEPVKDSFTEEDIRSLARKIEASSRPVLYAGGGVIAAGASEKLVRLAELADIPVVSTLMNLGAIPGDHELSLGLVGMHGQRDANLAVHNSDLLIAVGARFSDRVTGDTSRFAKTSEIIQIDIDESEVDKNVVVQGSLVGDMNHILDALIREVHPVEHKNWKDTVRYYARPNAVDADAFVPENIFRVLDEVMGHEDVYVATDVGQHQMWTAQFWKFSKPNHNITSGGLGTMGFGLGAAIGAQMAHPEARVLHVTGDGSFRMNMNELATVAGQKLPITTILLKNNVLGMVRQWQHLFHEKRYSATTLADVIDYVKLAEAYEGMKGYQVSTLEDLRKAATEARDSGHANLIVCDIDSDRSVWPIVPPGNALNDQILYVDMKKE